MTVIAWDGTRLAADKQMVMSGMISVTRKIRVVRGHLVGWSGDACECEEHVAWFERGAKPEEFPPNLRSDKYPSMLLVVTPEGKVLSYENNPYPVVVEAKHYALGSGREVALTAMHLGFDAIRAAEIACELTNGCGQGIDVLLFEDITPITF